MEKQDIRSLSGEAQEAIRVRAVLAALRGCKQLEIAEMFCVSRQSVGAWVKDYRTQGVTALKTKQKGRPRLKP